MEYSCLFDLSSKIMSWSEDFVKLLQSLQTAIKTTKCQSPLSAPYRCSSMYPYVEALRWWYHTIVNFNMAVQPSSKGSSTTMGEVWHHDAISIKRYWHLMSCTSIDIMFHQSLSSQLHLSVPVLFLSSLFIFSLSFSLNLNSPTPTYVAMYRPTWQYCVVKCNLSGALLYCYVLVTSGCQTVTWCPAGVIFNSRLVSV
jgi:hypothetical protein